MPKPFKCSIKVRSPAHAAVIEREYSEAAEEFKQFEE